MGPTPLGDAAGDDAGRSCAARLQEAGVAVSPAMNHGGPYPSTSHPGFTAVGIPASLARFAALQCYDNVRQNRLPTVLKDKIENPATWRLIDGTWVRG